VNPTAGGPGSLNNETSIFGPLTKSALAIFQKENGITPSLGYFGPITKAYMKSKGYIN
jgi:peptidoglycan hydrolase-like protein with peptidoglycan-binding domain